MVDCDHLTVSRCLQSIYSMADIDHFTELIFLDILTVWSVSTIIMVDNDYLIETQILQSLVCAHGNC